MDSTAFALVIDGDPRLGRIAAVRIRVAVATADWVNDHKAILWPGFAGTLRIRHVALPGSEVAILVGTRTGDARNASAYVALAP